MEDVTFIVPREHHVVNFANLTVMAWAVNAALAQKGIKGIKHAKTPDKKFSYHTGYFKSGPILPTGLRDIEPIEGTDVHNQFIECRGVKNAIVLESAKISPGAEILYRLLAKHGIRGINQERTTYREMISYDGEYFSHKIDRRYNYTIIVKDEPAELFFTDMAENKKYMDLLGIKLPKGDIKKSIWSIRSKK